MEPNNRWTGMNYSYSWSQPYTVSTNQFYYSTGSVDDEIARLEMIDRWVDSMLTYPDSECIINRVMKQLRGNTK